MNDRKQQVPDQIAVVSTATGSIELAYQEFGDGGDPVFLLITGWFSDLTLWPRGFCKVLAERGYRVIRYDNRDAGLSTRTVIDKIDPLNPPYTMSDLAGDAIGLLDALDVEQAHVAGFAFGGTISHLVAIEHPQRILSLVPLATASGARVDSSGAPLTVLPASIRGLFGTPFPEGAEELDQHHKRLFAAMAGSSFDEVEYDDRRKESALRGAELAAATSKAPWERPPVIEPICSCRLTFLCLSCIQRRIPWFPTLRRCFIPRRFEMAGC